MQEQAQVEITIKNYFAMWNEADAGKRRHLIESVYAADGRNVDPTADVQGWEAIDEFVRGLRDSVPGHIVSICSKIDRHHNRLRFGWALTAPDGEVVLSGLDCVTLAPDGRIAELIGFFDGPVPE